MVGRLPVVYESLFPRANKKGRHLRAAHHAYERLVSVSVNEKFFCIRSAVH